MDVPIELMKALARRLLAVEAANRSDSEMRVHEALRVYENLRSSLTRFAGPDGFTALMRRSLALARAEVPALQSVSVQPDGTILGLEEIAFNSRDAGIEATVAITSNLLMLLVTFIGEPLTLRLISDAWPEAPLEKMKMEIETL